MGWDAAASGNNARRSRSGSRAEGEPPPPPATGTSQPRRGESLLDLSGQTTPDLTPTESTARESSEFLTIWDDDDDHNPHGKVLTPDIISGSLQYGGGSLTTSTTTIPNPFEIATGLHLDGSTTSSSSSSAAAATTPGVPSLLRKEVEASVADGAGTGASGGGNLGREQPMSPSSARLFRNNNSTLTTPPISPLRRSSEYNGSSVRSPSPSPSPSRSPSSTTPRTTLRIKRLPASELAFFPAPSHSTSSPPSSLSLPRQGGTTRSDKDEDDDPDSTSSASSLFFRPLAKQLEQMSIPVPSFLVSSPSSAAARRSGVPSSSFSSATGKGNGSGRIRLPPSPNLAPSRPPTTLSRKDSSSLRRTGAGGGGGGGGGWNLLDFGAEEDEANQLAAVQLRQMQHASSPPPREDAMRPGPPGSSKSGFGSSHSSAHRHHHGNAESS